MASTNSLRQAIGLTLNDPLNGSTCHGQTHDERLGPDVECTDHGASSVLLQQLQLALSPQYHQNLPQVPI